MLSNDLRYALRLMRRDPGFTAVAVLSLAFGIGANTAIYSLFYTIMLRQLPVAHPEQLVEFLFSDPGQVRDDARRGESRVIGTCRRHRLLPGNAAAQRNRDP